MKGNLAQWLEVQAIHVLIHFIRKGKWSDIWLLSNSRAVANGLADGQGLGKNMLGVIWGGSMCINLSKWGKGVKTLVTCSSKGDIRWEDVL